MKNLKKILFALYAALTAAAAAAAPINLNNATAAELQTLPGIGPSKAAAIVEYRKQHGKIKSVEELKQAASVPDGVLNAIKPKIVL